MVDFCGLQFTVPAQQVLGRREMPGAEWFPGAKLNYAAHALRHERPGEDALLYLSERRPLASMKWTEFARQVRVLATWMQGRFATGAGALLKQRLLYGALRLAPEEIRHQGA